MNTALTLPDASASNVSTWLSPNSFDACEKIAGLMSRCGTMPQHLVGKPADCFRIVVQAAKWRMDPFAVAECTSLVHGRMCYEGKLVAAVLRSMNAIEGHLHYEITGEGQGASIVVTGKLRDGTIPPPVKGSVAQWRTHIKDKEGRPLKNAWDSDPISMLVYRGTRQWARLWASEAILGVVTPDEFDGETIKNAEVIHTSTAEPVKAKRGGKKDEKSDAREPDATPAAAGTDEAPKDGGKPAANATGADQSPPTGQDATPVRPSQKELSDLARKLLVAGPEGQRRLREVNAKWKLQSVEDMAGEGDDACIKFHADLIAAAKVVGALA